ncbi:MAG: hypothetical protein AB8G05_21865 [Oligoflexales bacterium]
MKELAKQRVQNQLRQFLKDFRNIKNISAEQAADILNVEIATYRILEGKKPANRVISVLEYLGKIADLNKMSLSTFINFLERTDRTESGSNVTKRKLFNWERDLLDKFDFIGIPLRNRFMAGFTDKTKEDTREILTCLTRIVSLSYSKRKVLFELVKEMDSKS